MSLDVGVVVFWLSAVGLQLVAAIASYRRGRCLSRYPVWRSALVAVLAYGFAPLWFACWFANRERIADEWETYRHERGGRKLLTG